MNFLCKICKNMQCNQSVVEVPEQPEIQSCLLLWLLYIQSTSAEFDIGYTGTAILLVQLSLTTFGIEVQWCCCQGSGSRIVTRRQTCVDKIRLKKLLFRGRKYFEFLSPPLLVCLCDTQQVWPLIRTHGTNTLNTAMSKL